jgi:DNA topoisomerase I
MAAAATTPDDAQPGPPAPARPAARRAARAAGLIYLRDDEPGIRRRRAGRGFVYTTADGDRLRDPAALLRIRALAIPPAWRDVWIAPSPRAHLQATGLDARGRKQYRYHPRWRDVRDAAKYARLADFGEAVPRLRQRVEHDLSLPGLPREKVLATVVRLLDRTFIRVGNETYARENGSFGLTTLRADHVAVSGGAIQFAFRGKSGVEHSIDLHDRRLARIIRRCQDLPGETLFQYVDAVGTAQSIGSADVNAYLRDAMGAGFTAKDFRTWAGTLLAARALAVAGPPASASAARRSVAAAIRSVAARLGNTPAVCRACYVHPKVLEAFPEGRLVGMYSGAADTAASEADERALVMLLREPAPARGRRRRAAPGRRAA